ncbi:MAG: acetyl-CoA carboxylase biotin carboxyl carrier protein subunit [Pseudomonadota bacterium]
MQIKTETGGSVWKISVKVGDTIEEGDVLFILEVMKMEVPYESPKDGTVEAIAVQEGDSVTEDQVVMTIA